jgi:hydroxyacylglutathione hydrolase
MTIEPISAFSDNYIWHLQTRQGGNYVVDPGDGAPVLAVLKARNLTLDGVLITHWHPDHTGGLQVLKQATGCAVWGPNNPAIEGIDHRVTDGDGIVIDDMHFNVMAVPGHTLDHIAYHSHGVLFCGDTLFAGGCGRVFEGTFPMMRASLATIKALPSDTLIYCAHEYTTSNLKFALIADPNNQHLKAQVDACVRLRTEGKPTVPSTLANEIATNPFLRWDDPAIINNLAKHNRLLGSGADDVFESLRRWKDDF